VKFDLQMYSLPVVDKGRVPLERRPAVIAKEVPLLLVDGPNMEFEGTRTFKHFLTNITMLFGFT